MGKGHHDADWTPGTLWIYFDKLDRDHRDTVQDALVALEQRVNERFVGTDRNLTTALTSAKEAAALLATAQEKRFDSVNEFRAQLADQARTFETKATAAARDERIARLERLVNAMEGRLTSRLDLSQGSTAGGDAARDNKRLDNAQVLGIAGFTVGLLSLIAVVVIAIVR